MIVAALTLSLMLVESPSRALASDGPMLGKPAFAKTVCKEKRVAVKGSDNGGRANLPFAMGRRFRTLDEYLTHLQCRAAPLDLPWYKPVKAGVYELQTGNLRKLDDGGAAQKRIFTRRELEKKFGFSS